MIEIDVLSTERSPMNAWKYAGCSYSPAPTRAPVPNVTHLAARHIGAVALMNFVSSNDLEYLRLADDFRTGWHKALREVQPPSKDLPLVRPEHDKKISIETISEAMSWLHQQGRFENILEVVQTISNVLPFLDTLYEQNANKASKKSIVSTIQSLFSWMAAGSFENINLVLRIAKIDALAPELMVAILRTTTKSRPHLSEWNNFLSKARQELGARGLAVDIILQGL